MEIKHHFIRDCYEKKLIDVVKIPTADQRADLFTKAFDKPRFLYLLSLNGVCQQSEILSENGVNAEVVKLNCITPISPDTVVRSVEKTGGLLAAEDDFSRGGVGQRLAAILEERGVSAKVALLNCGEDFVRHGAVPLLKEELGLDGAGIARRAMEVLGRG